MKDRGAEAGLRLVLSRAQMKRLERVARALQLTLPETVLLAIATRLPALEPPEPCRTGLLKETRRSPRIRRPG